MNVLDLFSGIGGFSLGLERAGMRTVAFCEINEYCRRILKKHWPDAPCYDDVRTLTADRLAADGIVPDVICGGFPCQDISYAGEGVGIEGKRSGLWCEYARLIEEVRPRWVIIENVAALRNRGLDAVLRRLAALGYDAEWHCISAAAVGARHLRDRIWIVAHPARHERGDRWQILRWARQRAEPGRLGRGGDVAVPAIGEAGATMADAEGERGWAGLCDQGQAEQWRREFGDGCLSIGEIWRVEPDLGRVADGVSNRVDRLSALGNAVVPQIPELIGRAIMSVQNLT